MARNRLYLAISVVLMHMTDTYDQELMEEFETSEFERQHKLIRRNSPY